MSGNRCPQILRQACIPPPPRHFHAVATGIRIARWKAREPNRCPMRAVPCGGGWTGQILGTPGELQSGFTPYEKSTVAVVPAATFRWWIGACAAAENPRHVRQTGVLLRGPTIPFPYPAGARFWGESGRRGWPWAGPVSVVSFQFLGWAGAGGSRVLRKWRRPWGIRDASGPWLVVSGW